MEYALGVLAVITAVFGGLLLRATAKAASAEAEAKQEVAEHAAEAARVENTTLVKSMEKINEIEREARADIAAGRRPDGVSKFDT